MGITTQSSKLPANPVGLYWAYWSPFKRLVDWSTTYNIIFLFHAYPAGGEAVGGNTGAVSLRKPTGTIGTNLNADIATCRARGQRIILSIGGAGGQTYIQTKVRADAFIASVKTINDGLGGSGTTAAIDGIDWNNFEGTSIAGSGTWQTYAGQQLKAYYGNDFIITSPPAGFSLSGPGAQPTSDRLLLAEMYAGDALDWLCPQFYDPSDLNTLANARLGLDVYHAAVTVNGVSVQIPRNHIGVGYGVATPGTTARWSPANAATAYTTLVSDGRAPKGGFNWAAHEDTGSSFAETVAPVMTNNVEPPISNPTFQQVVSSNFTDLAVTTARLTAPAGKTSGSDFQSGIISEATNPLTSLDLGSGKYTELEWCFQATAEAVNAAVYEFRVTYNGVALDTYTVTPTMTIGTPPPPPVSAITMTSVSSITGLSTITI